MLFLDAYIQLVPCLHVAHSTHTHTPFHAYITIHTHTVRTEEERVHTVLKSDYRIIKTSTLQTLEYLDDPKTAASELSSCPDIDYEKVYNGMEYSIYEYCIYIYI